MIDRQAIGVRLVDSMSEDAVGCSRITVGRQLESHQGQEDFLFSKDSTPEM
jgi:hypothetical protein